MLAYLPKNGCDTKGTFGLGKSPQNLPCADFMYAPQIGAAIAPPCALGPSGYGSFGCPTQTDVTSRGVKPTNHASVKLSTVPVLPAAGQPIWARVPVPPWTFCSRIL